MLIYSRRKIMQNTCNSASKSIKRSCRCPTDVLQAKLSYQFVLKIHNSFHSHRDDLLFIYSFSILAFFPFCFVSWILSQFSHCTLLIFTLVYGCYHFATAADVIVVVVFFFNSSHFLLYFFFASCTSCNCWIGILFLFVVCYCLHFLSYILTCAIVDTKMKCRVESI